MRAPQKEQTGLPEGDHRFAVIRALRGAEHEQLDDEIAELQRRIEAIEAGQRAPEDANGSEGHANASEENAEKPPQTVRLANALTRELRTETVNYEWTQKVERALREAKSVTSGIELEFVQCGARYCQASFLIDDGDVMALNGVLNLSVVEGEAFTVPGDDGTATLFLAAPGISLSELGADVKVTELSRTTTIGASPELSAVDASE